MTQTRCVQLGSGTVDEVRVALRSLKPGKSDGKYGLMSDHLINGGHLHECISLYVI